MCSVNHVSTEAVRLRPFFLQANLADTLPLSPPDPPININGETVAQILFTSGTTGSPRGVVHRHRHLTANLGVLARELDHHRLLLRLFSPLRFVDLVPLSHVFGQFMSLLLPPLMGASVVFPTDGRALVSVGSFADTERLSWWRYRGSSKFSARTSDADTESQSRKTSDPDGEPSLHGGGSTDGSIANSAGSSGRSFAVVRGSIPRTKLSGAAPAMEPSRAMA